MTVYELLCCFKAPNWCNYQNLLDPRYEFIPAKIELSLPDTAVDSYLGRLVKIALLLNKSADSLTFDTMNSFIQALEAMSFSGVLCSRQINPKMRNRIDSFLKLKLPSSWIRPLLEVFLVSFWSSRGAKTSLNDPKFFQTLIRLSQVSYEPLQSWFREHPEVLLPDTRYEET